MQIRVDGGQGNIDDEEVGDRDERPESRFWVVMEGIVDPFRNWYQSLVILVLTLPGWYLRNRLS